MAQTLTEHDGRRALQDHIVERALAARQRHGPVIDRDAILCVLDDRDFVRYPVGIRFDAADLRPGEFAHAMALGDHPREGFCLFVHPSLEARPDLLPMAIAYHLAPVNYGEIAGPEDCELMGATLLGLDPRVYYAELCALSDSLGGSAEA